MNANDLQRGMKNKRKKFKKKYLGQNQNEWNQYRVMKIEKRLNEIQDFGRSYINARISKNMKEKMRNLIESLLPWAQCWYQQQNE